jgi:hypothetical protein
MVQRMFRIRVGTCIVFKFKFKLRLFLYMKISPESPRQIGDKLEKLKEITHIHPKNSEKHEGLAHSHCSRL